jgi:hypothetical protein
MSYHRKRKRSDDESVASGRKRKGSGRSSMEGSSEEESASVHQVELNFEEPAPDSDDNTADKAGKDPI